MNNKVTGENNVEGGGGGEGRREKGDLLEGLEGRENEKR